jgi:hypothetical protein
MITEGKLKDWFFEKNGRFISDLEFESSRKKILKKYLAEILDPEDSEEYDLPKPKGKNPTKIFSVGGDTFEIVAESSQALIGFFKFSFRLIRSDHIPKPEMTGKDTQKYIQDLDQYEYGVTNTGNPIKVLKIIQSFMYRFIKKYSPRGISFKDYDEGRRSSVYGYMAKKVSDKSEYFLLKTNNYFFLFKNKDDMLKVKQDITAVG